MLVRAAHGSAREARWSTPCGPASLVLMVSAASLSGVSRPGRALDHTTGVAVCSRTMRSRGGWTVFTRPVTDSPSAPPPPPPAPPTRAQPAPQPPRTGPRAPDPPDTRRMGGDDWSLAFGLDWVRRDDANAAKSTSARTRATACGQHHRGPRAPAPRAGARGARRLGRRPSQRAHPQRLRRESTQPVGRRRRRGRAGRFRPFLAGRVLRARCAPRAARLRGRLLRRRRRGRARGGHVPPDPELLPLPRRRRGAPGARPSGSTARWCRWIRRGSSWSARGASP